MKNYILSEDEVVLFRGMVALHHDWKELATSTTYSTELLLTNINLVFMTESAPLFCDAIPQTLAVDEIKVYDNKIQIIRKKNTVEIYHKSGEIYLRFELEKAAKELCDKVLKVHSGYTKFVRSMKTAEKIIKENTEPLGIDAKQLAKDAAKVTCSAITSYVGGGKKGVGTAVKAIATALQSNKQQKEEALLLSEKTEKT